MSSFAALRRRLGALSPAWTTVTACAVLLVVFVLAALPALNTPFFWDDYHLIRTHTRGELASVWRGPWDTDGIETPGFRPLTAYFNHARAWLFGESVVAHRIFLLVLFAVFLGLIGLLGRTISAVPIWQVLLGAWLAFFHITSSDHYIWISDGIHIAAGILIAGAVLAFLQALRSGRAAWLAVSAVAAAAALLAREDSLVVYPLLLWFGAVYFLTNRERPSGTMPGRSALALFGAALLVFLGAYWVWRGVAVPKSLPVAANASALLWALNLVVHNVGERSTLILAWPGYGVLMDLWNIWLLAMLVVVLWFLDGSARRQVVAWGGALIISALPSLVVARSNLLLLPVACWGMLCSAALVSLWRRSSRGFARVGAGALLLFAIAAPAYGSLVMQQEQRPNSLLWICANADALYGARHTLSIPTERRDAARAQLAAYGIARPGDVASHWPALIVEAQRAGRFGLQDGEQPFIPHFDFEPMYPQQWGCAADLKQPDRANVEP